MKGLSEGPKNLELNEKSVPTSGGGASSAASLASNARLWSSPPPEGVASTASPHRSTVGIMGHMQRSHHPRKEHREPLRADLHRDLEGGGGVASPPLRSSAHHTRAMSPPPDPAGASFYSAGGSRSATADFGVYGNAFRGLPAFSGRSGGPASFSPGVRDRSPPPLTERGRSSYPPTVKEDRDRDDPYGDHPMRGSGGSRSGSVTGPLDRGTPASDKTDRHTPASHHGGGGGVAGREDGGGARSDREYDRASNRNTPPSPIPTPNSLGKSTPASFPSDSTTDLARGAASSSTYKERMRRSSEGGIADLESGNNNGSNGGSDRAKLLDFRRETDLQRMRSPSGGRGKNTHHRHF